MEKIRVFDALREAFGAEIDPAGFVECLADLYRVCPDSEWGNLKILGEGHFEVMTCAEPNAKAETAQ